MIIDILVSHLPSALLAAIAAPGVGDFPVLLRLAIVIPIPIAIVLCYLEGKTGQTPGRTVFGTRLLREADGRVPGFGAALARRMLHFFDVLPFYVGFLWPLWDEKKQTFADKMVRTVVVRSR